MSSSDRKSESKLQSDEYLEFLEDAIADADEAGETGEDDARAIREVAGALGAAVSPGAPPSPRVRDRLMASIAEATRLEHLADGVAELYGISRAAAVELLRRVDKDEAWTPGPIAGVHFLMVDSAAEAYADHMTALVKVASGTVFPWHEHVGEEHTLVLQGQCCEPDGTVYRPGQWIEHAAGTAHDFTTPPDGPDFVFATRVGPGFVTFGEKPE